MNKLSIRIFNLIAIVAIIVTYNTILERRQLEEQLNNSLTYSNNLLATQSGMVELVSRNLETTLEENEVATVSINDEAVPTGLLKTSGYKDGTYTGSGMGFGGDISVEVSISNGSITSITILSANAEDGAYLSMAEGIIPQIIAANTPNVDTISGATFSSTGIKNAVITALKDAK